jgi:hypothetical protein
MRQLAPEVGTLSVLAITLRYDFALSRNAFLLSRTVIAFNIYRSVHVGPVIASYSYRSDVIDKRYRIYWLSLLGRIDFKVKLLKTFFLLTKPKKYRKSFRQRVEKKIFVSAIIRGEESTITRRYSVTAIMLRYILSLSHNAFCCRETLLLLKLIALGVQKPLSLLILIELVTF